MLLQIGFNQWLVKKIKKKMLKVGKILIENLIVRLIGQNLF